MRIPQREMIADHLSVCAFHHTVGFEHSFNESNYFVFIFAYRPKAHCVVIKIAFLIVLLSEFRIIKMIVAEWLLHVCEVKENAGIVRDEETCLLQQCLQVVLLLVCDDHIRILRRKQGSKSLKFRVKIEYDFISIFFREFPQFPVVDQPHPMDKED